MANIPNNTCWLIIVSFVLVFAQEAYDLDFRATDISMYIGTPTQHVYVYPSLTTDIIFMISANCGELNTLECPRYCYDPTLSKLYCSAVCQNLEDFEWCNKVMYDTRHKFNSTNSSTFHFNGNFWRGNLQYYSDQIGQLARETMRFKPAVSANTISLDLKDWSFVNGMILDSQFVLKENNNNDICRLILNFRGFLGLAPGESNLVQLLYEQNRIPKPVASVVYWQSQIKVGDYNEENCFNWWHTKAEKSKWMVRLDSLMFFNQTRNANVLMTFDLANSYTYIPDDLFDEIVESGVIFGRSFNTYDIRCDVNFNLKLTINNHELFIPSFRFVTFISVNSCYTSIFPLRESHSGAQFYVDEPSWILGWALLEDYCLAYNYENNEIGFAVSESPFSTAAY
ncbi:Peptidase A1 domain-containing protein [Aphelenchoides besseyi]|nr:Peptidase A1 domain-containing protein [Aphelenchoides besseyi]